MDALQKFFGEIVQEGFGRTEDVIMHLGALDNQDVRRLQLALAGLGKVAGSAKLPVPVTNVLDMATVSSVNWAFTQHIGPGQAEVYLRTGSLSAALIRENILEITFDIINEIARRGAIPPFEALPPLPAGAVTMDAHTALTTMMSRYKLLTSISAALVKTEQAIGKLLPCAIIDSYNRLVKEYRAFGQSIFDALGARSMTIAQVAYRDGAPVLGPDGQPQIYKLSTPLLPPNFVARPQCPGMATLQGGTNELGIAPLILLGWIVVIGVSGHFGVRALKEVNILVRGPTQDTAKELAALTTCVSDLQAKGVSATQAATQCQAGMATPGLGLWGWLGVGAALLAVGGMVFYYLQQRVSRPALAGCGLGKARRRRLRPRGAHPVLLGDLYLHTR